MGAKGQHRSIYTHTSVLCDETPVHQSRSQAYPAGWAESLRVTYTNFALIGRYIGFLVNNTETDAVKKNWLVFVIRYN